MIHNIKRLQVVLFALALGFVPLSSAAGYTAGTVEKPVNLNSGDSNGSTKPPTYNPVSGPSSTNSSTPQPAAPPVNNPAVTTTNNLNTIVLHVIVVNRQLQRIPAYIWISGINPDGTSKNIPAKKGDAPQGSAFVKYVRLGESFQVMIKTRNGKSEVQKFTVSKNEYLKNILGQWVYVSTFVLGD